MPVIKFDVSGSDPDKATQDFEPPKPGVYRCKVQAINSGYSKGTDNKPDRERPRLEVIYEITDRKYKGTRLWDYISMTEASEWKLDQFLQAFGLATKTKRKGQFSTEKVVGQLCKVRVKGDKNQQGDYRAKVASVFAMGEDDEEVEDLEDEIEEEELEDEEETEEEEEEEELEEEEEADETEARYYDLEELQGMSLAALKDVATDLEIEDLPATKLVKKMAQYIFDNQPMEAPEEEEESDEEDDEEDDGYDELTPAQLKEELKERGLKTVGTKAALITRLREADAEGPF